MSRSKARSFGLPIPAQVALAARGLTFEGIDPVGGKFVAKATGSGGRRAEALGVSPADATSRLTAMLVRD